MYFYGLSHGTCRCNLLSRSCRCNLLFEVLEYFRRPRPPMNRKMIAEKSDFRFWIYVVNWLHKVIKRIFAVFRLSLEKHQLDEKKSWIWKECIPSHPKIAGIPTDGYTFGVLKIENFRVIFRFENFMVIFRFYPTSLKLRTTAKNWFQILKEHL